MEVGHFVRFGYLRLPSSEFRIHQRVESGDATVVVVDTAQAHDGLVAAVGEPCGLVDHLCHSLDGVEGGDVGEGKLEVGGMEGLAAGGLDDEFGVEGAEEALGEVADAVVD